jgi:hypothetical protein
MLTGRGTRGCLLDIRDTLELPPGNDEVLCVREEGTAVSVVQAEIASERG